MTVLIIILLVVAAAVIAYSINKKQNDELNKVEAHNEHHDLAPEATPEPAIVKAIAANEPAKAKKPVAKKPQAKKSAKKVK